jgi:excisionase family DNA binding protein
MIALGHVEILTVKGLARYLHCHPSTVYRLVNRGDIPGFRLGGGWRFKLDEIDRALTTA